MGGKSEIGLFKSISYKSYVKITGLVLDLKSHNRVGV